MSANVLEWEPELALFVPDDSPLLFYRKIAELGRDMLVSGGRLYFEINQEYGRETVDMLAGLGYKNIELRKDLFQNDRMIKAENEMKGELSENELRYKAEAYCSSMERCVTDVEAKLSQWGQLRK